MKIFHFIYNVGLGGAEHFVVDLANEQSKNHDVSLYAFRDDSLGNYGFFKEVISDKVNYINLGIEPGLKPGLIWSFYKLLKSEKPGIVHCHLNLVIYFFLLSLVFRRTIRIVYTLHSVAQSEVGSGLERLIWRFFFKRRLVTPVAISPENENSYTSFYKLDHIPVIYNGLKPHTQTPDFNKITGKIATLKFDPDTLVFCHIGRYSHEKNQKMLVSVFSRLYQEGHNVILLLLGPGFESADDLKKLAGGNVHFLGIVPNENISDYLMASDAFCLSSVIEGMPIALIEAFACGCTPVCTPVGGMVNAIQHGVTGFLSKTVSEEDYRIAVEEFIKHRKSINRDNLLRFFHENFDIEICASNYMKVYLNLA